MYLETTPDTSGYMIAGFIVAFAVMGLYILSMFLRNRNLNRDLTTLESIQSQAKPKAIKSKLTKKAKPSKKEKKK